MFGSSPTSDDNSKILSFAATHAIAKLDPTERSWDKVASVLTASPLIVLDPDNSRIRVNVLDVDKEGQSLFTLSDDHTASHEFVDEVGFHP